jgi:predicted MFS family arabinose efflux permease
VNASARLAAVVRGGLLADGNFRLLTGGQLTSTIGDYCYAVALPWLVLSGGGGPALLGTVLACYGVPRVVALPAGGVLADRIDPRRVMLFADIARAILAGLLVVVAARHVAALAVLAPIAVGLGAGEGLFLPAANSIMPSLLATDRLAAGNAINMAALQAGSVLGPVLGGAMVAAGGSAPAFAVDAASFAVSAVTLALLRLSRAAAAAEASVGDAETDAVSRPTDSPDATPGLWQFVRRERLLKLLMLVTLVANFGTAGTFEVATPTLAHARWGASGYGALLACIGVGTVAGTLASARAARLRRPAVAACLALLICAASIAALPFLGGLPGAAAAAVLLGVGLGFGNTVMITLAQQWVPNELLGRVMGLVMMCAIGFFPVSTVVTGVLVHVLGPSPFFVIAGAALAAAILGALSQPAFRRFGASDAESKPGLAPSVSSSSAAAAG